jgi:ornithine cyclodeaminase/alanine dehydrogenase-like protein (mu-crystallin family)
MNLLTRSDLQKCLSMTAAIDAMAEAFSQLSAGTANVPLRTPIRTGDGVSLFMPALLTASHALGMKLVSVHAGNLQRGLPAILGFVALVDEETGEPLVIMDGGYITAVRTAAGSGLATKLMARPDAKVAAIIGAGPQGRAHIQAMLAVRPLVEIRVTSRSLYSAEKLAAEPRSRSGCEVRAVATSAEAVRGADIVCLCSSSATPVFAGADLKRGAHINGIGSHAPTTREIGDDAITRIQRIVVDMRTAAMAEAGDLIIPIKAGTVPESIIYAELGEVVLGQKKGRETADEITFFKSVGIAAQDVAAGRAAFVAAQKMGLGLTVDLRV